MLEYLVKGNSVAKQKRTFKACQPNFSKGRSRLRTNKTISALTLKGNYTFKIMCRPWYVINFILDKLWNGEGKGRWGGGVNKE